MSFALDNLFYFIIYSLHYSLNLSHSFNFLVSTSLPQMKIIQPQTPPQRPQEPISW